MRTIILAITNTNNTISFAVQELEKYFKLIDREVMVDERICKTYDASKPYLWVGADIEFPIKTVEVEDKQLDDAIYIDVQNFKGIISGVNERAVLIAAYRFLRELGVAFVRPTGDGEVVPEKKLDTCNICISEAPSYRHRGICIEGANSFEHVRNMLDWMPKVGMNEYMLQFANPVHFFERWYFHEGVRGKEPFPMERDEGYDIKRALEAEIAKRGILYHDVGHGWTMMHLGLGHAHETTPPQPVSLTEEQCQYLALVNGKRGIWNKRPIWTELCYSNPRAQEAYVNAVVDYCEKNPQVDYIMLALSDGTNNHCQCEECMKSTPSDFYVQMMNSIDEKLTEKGIKTKAVFELYHDTFFAPKKERIRNKDRFLMMFAPIDRAYYQTYADMDLDHPDDIPPLNIRATYRPSKVSTVVAMLDKWREVSPAGDYVSYEYYMWEPYLRDPGYTAISKILFEDVYTLDRLHMNGMQSCQMQRFGLPTNLPMWVMSESLWNKHADYEQICTAYYDTAFGPEGALVRAYLEKLSALLAPLFADEEAFKKLTEQELADMAKAASLLVTQFEEKTKQVLSENQIKQVLFESNAKQLLSENTKLCEAQLKSWYYLSEHCKIAKKQAEILERKYSHVSEEELNVMRDELEFIVSDMEEKVHKAFDAWGFTKIFRKYY